MPVSLPWLRRLRVRMGLKTAGYRLPAHTGRALPRPPAWSWVRWKKESLRSRLDWGVFDLLVRVQGARDPAWFRHRVQQQMEARWAIDAFEVEPLADHLVEFGKILACTAAAVAWVMPIGWPMLRPCLYVAAGFVVLRILGTWIAQGMHMIAGIRPRYAQQADEVMEGLSAHEWMEYIRHTGARQRLVNKKVG